MPSRLQANQLCRNPALVGAESMPGDEARYLPG